MSTSIRINVTASGKLSESLLNPKANGKHSVPANTQASQARIQRGSCSLEFGGYL